MKNRRQSRGKRILPLLLLLCLLLTGCSSPLTFLDQLAWELAGESGSEGEETAGEGQTEEREGTEGENEGAEAEVDGMSYGYAHISEEAQLVYRQILACIESYEESVEVSTKDANLLEEAYRALMSDRGDLFYVNSYSYVQYTNAKDEILSLEFKPAYTMSEAEKEAYQSSIDEIVSSTYLSRISEEMTDYEKALSMFEALIENVSYQKGAEQNQNIISSFVYGQTVCQGYASAYQYLMQLLGIPSFIVTGTASGSSHAWNMIFLDGNWYNVDVTWGNASYSLDGQGEGQETDNYVNYAYFCIGNALLNQTHEAEEIYELPDTLSDQDSYYVHEGLYFTGLDVDAMDRILAQAYSEQRSCSMMMADEKSYQEVLDFYITKQNITAPCPGITSIKYIQDPVCHVLIFQF